jgi:hypothetical protein
MFAGHARVAYVRVKSVGREHGMSAFTVELKNQPGARGVNLVLCGMSRGGSGTVAFVADDEAAARTALAEAGMEFTERPALTVRMDNVPGAGAGTFRKLADADVNMELLLPIRVSNEQFFAVICVNDLDAASQALGEQVVSD